jgi:hypothetical protein
MSAKIINLVDLANEAMSIPKKLTTDDGREILIERWTGSFAIDGVVRVEISGTIRLTKKEKSDL